MKKSALTILAFLALAGVAFATPVLSLVDNGPVGVGLNSYTIQATEDLGTAIVNLSKFEITTAVNQVWTDVGGGVYTGQTEWGSAGGVTDSYVIWGDTRIDGYEHLAVPPTPDYVTVETNAASPGAAEGMGTLNNYDATGGIGGIPTWDAYLDTTPDYTGGIAVDLLQLVVADTVAAGDIALTLTLTSATGPGVLDTLGPYDLALPVVGVYENGDTDGDGFITFDPDFINFSAGWFGPDGADPQTGTPNAEWLYGDFDGDLDVDFDDFILFSGSIGVDGWFGPNGAGAPVATAVPEPSTIVMLILGALCLVGYRVRK